jgi:hypothetical protein
MTASSGRFIARSEPWKRTVKVRSLAAGSYVGSGTLSMATRTIRVRSAAKPYAARSRFESSEIVTTVGPPYACRRVYTLSAA